MSNCIDIRIWNLAPEAVNRLAGATSASLDITDRESIRLTKSVEALSNTNKLQTAGVLPFSVPSTATNDAVFIEHLTPLTVDNRRKFYDVAANIDGHPLEFNRIVVVSSPKNAGDSWGLEFRRSPDHWIELSQALTINKIPFGTFEFTEANILTNWENDAWKGEAGQVPYRFPVMDYGAWVDRTEPVTDSNNQEVKAIANEDLRPLVSLPYLLKQGFCEIGWSIEGVIFDSDWFARLWVYALSQTYYEGGSRIVWTEQVPDTVTIPGGPGGAGVNEYGEIQNTLNIGYQYTFQFFGQIRNDGASAVSQVFKVGEVNALGQFFGETLSEDVAISIGAGETRNISLTFSVTLTPQQRAAFIISVAPASNLKLIKGSIFYCYPDDRSLYTGQTVTISDCLRNDQTLFQWFKAAAHLCRWRVSTDHVTKTVTVFPKNKSTVYGTVIPGFIRDEEANIDISQMVVEESVEMKPIRPEQVRYTQVKFKDSTDSYIDSLKLLEQPHSRKLLNGINLPDDVTVYENLLIEPTLELGAGGRLARGASNRQPAPILPRMWDNNSGERSFNIQPRIFFSFGKVRQVNPAQVNEIEQYTGFFFNTVPNQTNTGLVSYFGYDTQLRTWNLDPAPTIDGNVVFGTQQNDLFTNFYLSISQELRGGFDIDALMLMRMADFVNIDFRSVYRFIYRGRPISAEMTKIRDAALCGGLPTPVTFFVPPVETECCDLPCGCQFSTCEYYMDIGTSITQATLDDLSITTFTVDGLSVITTAVPLGTLKVVNVLGRPYVTNLVDALNSVGAPYFTFAYSSRISALKGARFFTVKRPACTPFEIVISYGEIEVYRYTDTVQETNWFGGGFGPLGYMGEEYSEPENCVITTEY